MVKRPRKFCDNQTICKEDEGKGTYSCLAHLAEARVFQCSYKESKIKFLDEYGDGHRRFIIQNNPRPGADGVCRDFEITPKVKKDLIKKIEEEPKKS